MKALLARWRVWLVAAAACLAVGARVHPQFDLAQPSFGRILASPLFSKAWVPDHALILAGLVLLTLGLAGLVGSGLLSGAAAVAGRVAIIGGALSALEMVFHLSAVVERDALVAGAPTPVITIQEALQVVSHPLLGFAVAAIAVANSGRLGTAPLGWAWRIVSAVGLAGAVAHGLAGPVVVLGRNAALGVLFSGAAPMAVYLAGLAVLAPRLTQSSDPETAVAPSDQSPVIGTAAQDGSESMPLRASPPAASPPGNGG